MERSPKRQLEVPAFKLRKDGEDVTRELYDLGADNSQRLGRQLDCINRQLDILNAFAQAAGHTINAEILSRAFHMYQGKRQRVCLFNIIIALEWMPSPTTLESLQKTFTQASALLFDVTDGYMAIGQVVVGGKELMECADIQIFASNRLFPRSSVDGLNNAEKYQPIRLGRGLWNKNERTIIPWDEQKGYATIVHEWGHYALGLKDQYLRLDKGSGLVTPVSSLTLNTIMASLEKTELLSYRPVLEGADQATEPKELRRVLGLREDAASYRPVSEEADQATKAKEVRRVLDMQDDSEWEVLRRHPRFSWLNIPVGHQKIDEPPPEMPYPAFHIIATANDPYPPQELLFNLEGAVVERGSIDPQHCWVYVIKGAVNDPTGLVAQGEFEATGEFRLLGAQPGDAVVLVGSVRDWPDQPLVLWAQIADDANDTAHMEPWQDATPRPFPILDVAATGESAAPPYNIELKIHSPDEWNAIIFPLGRGEKRQGVVIPGVTVLDGHVMLVSNKGLAIASYALGGSPFSGYPAHPNPIPAGSADGNAMVFFYDERDAPLRYADIYPGYAKLQGGGRNFDASKVVVTTNLEDNVPPPGGYLPRSYTFSVTSNISFRQLAELHPTLVLHYDQETRQETGGELRIGRYNPISHDWDLLKTDDRRADYFAAASLEGLDRGWGLLADPPEPDHFRLFLGSASSAS